MTFPCVSQDQYIKIYDPTRNHDNDTVLYMSFIFSEKNTLRQIPHMDAFTGERVVTQVILMQIPVKNMILSDDADNGGGGIGVGEWWWWYAVFLVPDLSPSCKSFVMTKLPFVNSQVIVGRGATLGYTGPPPSEEAIRARMQLSTAEYAQFLDTIEDIDDGSKEIFELLKPLYQPRGDLMNRCVSKSL